VELSRVDHDSLATYKERVLVPGDKTLEEFISLIGFNEFIKIGFPKSKSVRSNGQSCHQGSGLHESLTKHHLGMYITWIQDIKWPAKHSSFMAMAFDMHSPEMNSIHVYHSTCYPSREAMSRTNLQLAVLQREIDRYEVKIGRNRMENVMRRPHLPPSDRGDSAELCLSVCRSLSHCDYQNAQHSPRKRSASTERLDFIDSHWTYLSFRNDRVF
jgi:hypothetical protein